MTITDQMLRAAEARYADRQRKRDSAKAEIEAGDVLKADSSDRVQKRLARLHIDEGALKAIMDSGLSFAAVATPGAAAAADPVVLERLLGTNDLMGISFLNLGLQVSRTVGRITIRRPNGQVRGFGTGFMVSPRLLLTNNHVLGSSGEAAASFVEFDY